jgi:uncharacterized protein YeaO (DUF488 family)
MIGFIGRERGDMPVLLKRVYEKVEKSDGCRILVDGLWPRGFTKNELELDKWMREIAPSAETRKWYGHRPDRWEEFRRRYRRELESSPRKEMVEELVRLARSGKVTLVFAARDIERSNAAVLQEIVNAAL